MATTSPPPFIIHKYPEWISVKSDLPDENKMVLCFCSNQPIHKYVIASYEPDIDLFVDYDDCAYAPEFWMSLPEPPILKTVQHNKLKCIPV